MIRKMPKDNNKRNIKVLIFFIIVILGYHLLLREYVGDFIEMFAPLMKKDSLVVALGKRYANWSSRVLIEAPLILLSHNNSIILWKIFNFSIWLALAFSLMYLTHHKNDTMLIGMLLMYPVIDMASAGWIATYINYLWPLTAGCVSLIALDKMYHNKKIYCGEAIGYLVLELFATNFETFAVMYECILLWYIWSLFYEKRFELKRFIFCMLQVIVATVGIIFALTCPGNFVRKQQEIGRWLIDFTQWTLVDKVVMGINTTMHSLFDANLLFAVFLVVLFCCCLYTKKLEKCVVGIIPIIFLATRTVLKPVMAIYFPVYNQIFDANDKINSINYNKGCMYVPFIIYMSMLVCVIWIILNIIKEIKKSIEFVVIFVSALLTRIAIGFSPTLYASGNRTFIFLNFTLIFLSVCIYSEYEMRIRDDKKIYRILKSLFICVVGISVLGNLISINR